MVRGVSKRVVEITNTENEYFERVLLFVSTEKLESDEKQLKKEADRLVGSVTDIPAGKRHRGKKGFAQSAVKVGCGALGGAAASALFFLL